MIELSRAEVFLLAVSVWMLGLGAGALLLGTVRPRASRRTTLLFGAFSLLYGAIITVSLPLVRAAFDLQPAMLTDIRLALTYSVLLPLVLLVHQFVGRGWHDTMRMTVWLQFAYTLSGLVTANIAGLRIPFLSIKPYIVLTIGAAALGNVWIAWRRGVVSRSLVVGFIIFLATVGVYNLGLIFDVTTLFNVEMFGYVALVGCLAYAVAVQAVESEATLLSIGRELDSAQRIQASILPARNMSVPGVRLVSRYRPTTAMAGDFFDVVRLGDRQLGVLICDVLGHGIGASLIASMVKVAFVAERLRADSPGSALEGINRTLVGLLEHQADYVTAGYVVIDSTGGGTLRYSLAGHPPPLLLSRDGSVSALEAGGTILGSFPEAVYPEGSRQGIGGSRLVMYTDGVTEAMNAAGEMFGIDRLRDFLRARRTMDPDTCADALLAEIVQWVGRTRLDDDVTVVFVDCD